MTNLRFHWMLPKGRRGGCARTSELLRKLRVIEFQATSADSPAPLPDMEGWVHFAQHAEAAGIDLVTDNSFSRYEPDPFVVSCALGQATGKLKFIAAYRSGLMQRLTFVQRMTRSRALIPGPRLSKRGRGQLQGRAARLWRFSRP